MMNSKEFKNIFSDIAKKNGFLNAFDGWYKETSECIAVLDLQKSTFADSYYLNIKIFVQGVFKSTYTPSKDLTKRSIGHIINQIRDEDFLSMNTQMEDNKRQEKIEKWFKEYIVPFTDKTLSRSGIKELAKKEKIFLLPAVKQELV